MSDNKALYDYLCHLASLAGLTLPQLTKTQLEYIRINTPFHQKPFVNPLCEEVDRIAGVGPARIVQIRRDALRHAEWRFKSRIEDLKQKLTTAENKSRRTLHKFWKEGGFEISAEDTEPGFVEALELVKALDASRTQIIKKMNDLEKHNRNQAGEITKQLKDKKALKAQLEALKAQLEALKAQPEAQPYALKAELEAVDKIHKLKGQVQAGQIDIAMKEMALRRFNEERLEMQKKMRDLEVQVNDLKRAALKHETETGKMLYMKDTIRTQQAQIRDLEETIASLGKGKDDEDETMQEIEALRTELDKQFANVSALQCDRALLRKELTLVRKKLDQLGLEDTMETVLTQNGELNEQVEVQAQYIKYLESQARKHVQKWDLDDIGSST